MDFSDAFAMVLDAIAAAFQWQSDFWNGFGVLPSFLLVFMGFTFYRLVISRFTGGYDGASDSVVKNYVHRDDD